MDEMLTQVDHLTGQGGRTYRLFLQFIISNGTDVSFPASTVHLPEKDLLDSGRALVSH